MSSESLSGWRYTLSKEFLETPNVIDSSWATLSNVRDVVFLYASETSAGDTRKYSFSPPRVIAKGSRVLLKYSLMQLSVSPAN